MEVTKQAWPDVDEEDWCGEFERDLMKPDKPEVES